MSELPEELLAALRSGNRINQTMKAMGAAGKLPFQLHVSGVDGQPNPEVSEIVTICGNIFVAMATECHKSGANWAHIHIALVSTAMFLAETYCPEDIRADVLQDAINILKGKVIEA